MNFKKILCLAIAYLALTSSAFATKLPDNVLNTIKKEVPDIGVRFDGMITFPDKTVYLPVLPSQVNKSGKGEVAATYPANKKISDKPEVIVFDTNLALLKVIKNKQGKPSFTDTKNIPLGVKTGLLPQDMLVPPGMVIPDDMKIIMGDLVIPTVSSYVNTMFTPEPAKEKEKNLVKIEPVEELKGKTFLITTLDSNLVNVVPTNSTIPDYTLRLDSLPRFIEPVENDNYILVASRGKTYIDVADIKHEVLAKKIDLSFHPSEIIIDNNRAFVAVSDDSSIFVVDLKSMTVIEKIKLKGYPKHIVMDANKNYIAYADKTSGDIFTLDIAGKFYDITFTVNCPNVSKIYAKDNLIYALCRTENKLKVIDTKINEIIYEQELGAKPVDMIEHSGKLYIVSGNNELCVFNLEDYQVETTKKLETNGFTNKIIPVPDSSYAVITNASDKKYFVYDLDKNEVAQTVPTAINIYNIKLINKVMK